MKTNLKKIEAVLKTVDKDATAFFFFDSGSIPMNEISNLANLKLEGVQNPIFIVLDVPSGKTIDECVVLYQLENSKTL